MIKNGIGDLDDLAVSLIDEPAEEKFMLAYRVTGKKSATIRVFPTVTLRVRFTIQGILSGQNWRFKTDWYDVSVNGYGNLNENGAGLKPARLKIPFNVPAGITNLSISCEVSSVVPQEAEVNVAFENGSGLTTQDPTDTLYIESWYSEEREIEKKVVLISKVLPEWYSVKPGEAVDIEVEVPNPRLMPGWDGSVTDLAVEPESSNPNVLVTASGELEDHDFIAVHITASVFNKTAAPVRVSVNPGFYYLNGLEDYLYSGESPTGPLTPTSITREETVIWSLYARYNKVVQGYSVVEVDGEGGRPLTGGTYVNCYAAGGAVIRNVVGATYTSPWRPIGRPGTISCSTTNSPDFLFEVRGCDANGNVTQWYANGSSPVLYERYQYRATFNGTATTLSRVNVTISMPDTTEVDDLVISGTTRVKFDTAQHYLFDGGKTALDVINEYLMRYGQNPVSESDVLSCSIYVDHPELYTLSFTWPGAPTIASRTVQVVTKAVSMPLTPDESGRITLSPAPVPGTPVIIEDELGPMTRTYFVDDKGNRTHSFTETVQLFKGKARLAFAQFDPNTLVIEVSDEHGRFRPSEYTISGNMVTVPQQSGTLRATYKILRSFYVEDNGDSYEIYLYKPQGQVSVRAETSTSPRIVDGVNLNAFTSASTSGFIYLSDEDQVPVSIKTSTSPLSNGESSVTVRVLDEWGSPVPGAKLTVTGATITSTPFDLVTDRDGLAVFSVAGTSCTVSTGDISAEVNVALSNKAAGRPLVALVPAGPSLGSLPLPIEVKSTSNSYVTITTNFGSFNGLGGVLQNPIVVGTDTSGSATVFLVRPNATPLYDRATIAAYIDGNLSATATVRV